MCTMPDTCMVVFDLFIIPIILFKLVDGPIRNTLNIPNGSSVEMYSIPAQQMARIYKYEDNLSEEYKTKIEKYISADNIEQIYDPLLSDPIKAKLNENAINNEKIEFLKFIIELAIKYPATTFESFTCTTYRFFYLDNEIARGIGKYKEQSRYVVDNLLPAEMNVNSNKNSIKIIESIDELIYKNDMPIVSVLYASGVYISIFIMCIGYLIYSKKYKYSLAFMPVLLVLLTQMAGPVVDQRYTYSIFTCFPILLGMTIYIAKEKINNYKM